MVKIAWRLNGLSAELGIEYHNSRHSGTGRRHDMTQVPVGKHISRSRRKTNPRGPFPYFRNI